MKVWLWVGLACLACLTLVIAPAFAKAMMIAPAPIAQRVALSDAVVVGKVTGFGDKLVSVRPPWGGDKVDYQIAIVQVEEDILGAKGVKEIKVGFIPPPSPPPPASGPGPKLLVKRRPQFNLILEQEACMFLVKHPDADFYTGQNYYDLINKRDEASFGKDMDEVKRCARLLADPAAGLKAKDADDRFLTAAMLVTRYRWQKPGAPAKAEPIDAEESKQILLTLADADWAPKVGGPGPFTFRMTPQSVFYRLGLTEKDGWTQPKEANAFADAARKWLKDNADKYRIERFVADKGDK